MNIPEREENDFLFSFRKPFSQKREPRSVHMGQEKTQPMRNSGSSIAERYSHLRMKVNCSMHSQIGGALCGLFA